MNAIQVTEYGFNNASFPIYRYLFELKEDDDACKKAQQTGAFYLFHSLAPLLQKSGHQYQAPRHSLLGKAKRTSRVDQPVAFKQNLIHIKSLRRILQFQSPDFSNYFYQLIIQCINLNCPNISDGMNHCCLKLGLSETAVQIGTHHLFCKYWNTAMLNSLTYCLWLFSHYSGRAEWL